jgi:predicted  nucleic acid-binding Zn-ribbon protein
MSWLRNFSRRVETAIVQCYSAEVKNINRKLDQIMATLQERFNAIDANLTEASNELTTELTKLRDALANASVTLPPEAEASLANIEAKAKGLADVIPNE